MMSHYENHRATQTRLPSLLAALLCLCVIGTNLSAQTPGQADPSSSAPRETQAIKTDATNLPIMKLDDVRIGMKGYGLTVFNGVKIETFPVEVISVQRDFSPKHGVVWVRCTDERMQLSGPVHGMSGSPIFLWPKGQEKKDGEGGKLIGAFAFGYENVKDCYVGIQPIEYMLQVGGRVVEPDPQASKTVVPANPAAARLTPAQVAQMIRRFTAASAAQGAPDIQNWQAQALAAISDPSTLRNRYNPHVNYFNVTGVQDAAAEQGQPLLPAPPELEKFGNPKPLLVPMAVGSPAIARLMSAMLEPMGIAPMAGVNSTIASRPPSEIEADKVVFAPGSVLSIPLAWGDLDVSAAGTVTALTTDGHVLGFGHAMFGDGATALPMATGYVHFVMPSVNSSFKLGGSLQLKGAILRDEQVAVAGAASGVYTTAPVKVSVSMPGQPERNYKYEVVHHQTMTPMICAIVTMQSMTAAQDPPTINTLHLVASLRFNDEQVINIDTYLPMADPSAAASQILPALTLMANNPYESTQIQSVDVHATYQAQVMTSTLVRGRINQPVVAPGDDVDITLWLQPYGKELQSKHVKITLPSSLPDGDYQIVVGGAQSYMGMVLGTRPHIASPTDQPSLFNLLKNVMEVDNTALYVMLQTDEISLAVGQQELPNLPSSKKAMLVGSASTVATPFPQWVETKFDTTQVIEGQQAFVINVRRSRELSRPGL